MKKMILMTTAMSLLSYSPSYASEQGIAELEAKIERLERVIGTLVKTQEAQPTVSLKPGLRVVSADKANSFGIDGFVQADTGVISSRNTDLEDGATIKRARLGIKGTIDHDWKYRFLTEFGNDDFQLIDANVGYHGFENTAVTVGQFKEPFSLEQLTAAKYWTFNEKASMAALTPKRSIGAGVAYQYEDGLVSIGAFGENVNKKRTDDEGKAITARMTYLPIDTDGELMHVGLSGSFRKTDAQTSAVRFKNAGENTLTSSFVDTGTIANAEHVASINPEFLYIDGPLSLQAEYIHTQVGRDAGSDLAFSGYYGEASYFLTGESRNYVKKKGAFGKVKPNANFNSKGNGWGAWQVAYRYSHLDLNDADITGGTLDSHTLGLNWLPNSFIRVSANAMHHTTDHQASAPNEEATIFMLRTQFEF